MRTNKMELDVDFIGGLGSLTTEEEKALSDFFKQPKPTKIGKKSKPSDRAKTTA